ncbi:hypothetical protein BDV34DRAFT_88014 [Aspergillus parasiticus]|uniref:Uncharacterized protein n=1 Tax=Aspergillus parasiticus TaxID=5067 RepID=A0A5N6E3C7_ASPPA|nr:hypothetical protein BDV34DRAFT_88014 [Aspergillus parasiticus]
MMSSRPHPDGVRRKRSRNTTEISPTAPPSATTNRSRLGFHIHPQKNPKGSIHPSAGDIIILTEMIRSLSIEDRRPE